MADDDRPVILCVDDEPQVLEALVPHLRKGFRMRTATGGVQALALIEREGPPAVVISDMRMPAMDGATLLAKVRLLAPDSVRMLLTGHTDLDAAISAVNEGQIFRFLTKPCPPAVLQAAARAAVEQHRLVTAERVLLERTLHGSVKAMIDILAVTSPLLFGRAQRIRQLVDELARSIGHARRWQLDIAAMLSQIGCVGLPGAVAEKLHQGRPLAPREQEMVDRAPALAQQLLAHIPRLEDVRALLEDMHRPWHRLPRATDPASEIIAREAQLLRIAAAYDALESAGRTPADAHAALAADTGAYDPALVAALALLRTGAHAGRKSLAMAIAMLDAGMILEEELRLANGSLLAARGYEITSAFLERLANFEGHLAVAKVQVLVSA